MYTKPLPRSLFRVEINWSPILNRHLDDASAHVLGRNAQASQECVEQSNFLGHDVTSVTVNTNDKINEANKSVTSGVDITSRKSHSDLRKCAGTTPIEKFNYGMNVEMNYSASCTIGTDEIPEN